MHVACKHAAVFVVFIYKEIRLNVDFVALIGDHSGKDK